MRQPLLLPVILIAAGALFLAGNLGLVAPVSVRAVVALWPVILVVVGIAMLVGRERPYLALGLQLAAVAAGVALIASGPSFVRTVTAAPPVPGAAEVVVTASELRFSPSEITLPAAAVNLTLRNDGVLTHDLTIPVLGVHLTANSGEAATSGLRGLPRGRYAAYCSVSGHHEAGMRLTVNVE
jgi:uncharacterized cupredoxin-like copper-binding protein